MNEKIVGILFLLGFFAFVAAILWIMVQCIQWLRTSNAVQLEWGITVRELGVKFLAHRWTVRELLIPLVVLIPCLLLISDPSFSQISIILIACIGYVVAVLIKPPETVSTDVDNLTMNLLGLLTKVTESASYIETLVATIRSREMEAHEKTVHLKALQEELSQTQEKAKAFDDLTEKQKEMFLEATKKAQDPGTSRFVLAMALAVFLNIVATVIWSMLGNPGRDELLNLTKGLFH